MPAKEPMYLGIDIGGTKVAAGMVTARGEILSKVRVPMSSRGSEAEGLGAVERAIATAFESEPKRRASVAAIGISSPGPLDPRKGIIINPPNLPCWQNFPLAAKVRQLHRVPTFVDNDANAAALAEAIWGAGRGYESVFYATLGTGIGTGVILGGRIYHGRTGAAAEGGHVSIDYHGPKCACGKLGCIEALAAGPAVAKRARERLRGGSPGELFSEWFARIREQLPAWTINSRCKEIPFVRARYGEDSGIAGAAALCLSASISTPRTIPHRIAKRKRT